MASEPETSGVLMIEPDCLLKLCNRLVYLLGGLIRLRQLITNGSGVGIEPGGLLEQGSGLREPKLTGAGKAEQIRSGS